MQHEKMPTREPLDLKGVNVSLVDYINRLRQMPEHASVPDSWWQETGQTITDMSNDSRSNYFLGTHQNPTRNELILSLDGSLKDWHERNK